MTLHACLTAPGFEDALAAEVAGAGAVRPSPCPGVVLLDAGAPLPDDPVFSRQPLPCAALVQGASVARLAQAAFDALAGPVDAAAAWTLHAFAPPALDADLGARARLLGGSVLDLFRRNRRRSARRLVAPSDVAPGAAPLVAQVLLVAPGAALVSAAAPRPLAGGLGLDVEPRWPGGYPDVAADRAAPSSAYRKAEEAYALLGDAPRPGQRCVDLGASPGGWTWTALRRGAHVTAVDRAPLLPPAHGHERVVERRGDALRFQPDALQVDWLLCDVVAAPPRTIELLGRWLAGAWCARFAVNVKFRGADRAPHLGALRDLLVRHGARARVKHLPHDKNEVTAVGVAGPRTGSR